MKIFQPKILSFLFVAAATLLVANILIERTLKKSNNVEELSITSENLQFRFESSLKSFGLRDEWLKKKIEKSKKQNRNYPSYKVTLPIDLSIPEVLLEIHNEFRNDSLLIESEEKHAGGKSILIIKENNLLILSAVFDYSKNITRDMGALAFVIKNIELDNLNDSLLIETPDKFNVLITPSQENLNHLSYIIENRKNYSVIIDDEIIEANYKLELSYSLLRITNVIKALSVDYANASFFVIDNNFDFYHSDKFEFFRTELEKRRVKLHTLSDFIFLDDKEKISERFHELVKDLRKGEVKIIVLSKNDYLQLKQEISYYKTAGLKIINTSEIIL